MRFYRGILISDNQAENVKEEMLKNGVLGEKESACYVHNMKDKLTAYFENINLSLKITRPSVRVDDKSGFHTEYLDSDICIYCSGDLNTAAFYANRERQYSHKIIEAPLVVEFEANLEDVHIDSRDFLATCFSTFRITNVDVLTRLFGKKILDYYDKAKKSNNSDYAFAMLDLACQDSDIVLAHYNNKDYIEGRYHVNFVSSFTVKAPIKKESIIDVYAKEYDNNHTISISINDVR